jgi:hypothetical protein
MTGIVLNDRDSDIHHAASTVRPSGAGRNPPSRLRLSKNWISDLRRNDGNAN